MSKAIDYFAYDNKFLGLKTYFSMRARKKMYNMFEKYTNPKASDEVLDLGATPDTKLADSNLFDKLYPYKEKLTVASIENCEELVQTLKLKKFVYNYPKKALPFKDKEFDICFCSAVLEHVGNHDDQQFFLNECKRVSKKTFLTTPYRFFPLEMHTFIPFLHWLPWNWFQAIVRHTKGEFWANSDNLMLCSKRDIKKMNLGSAEVKIKFVHTIGLPSNMIIMINNEQE